MGASPNEGRALTAAVKRPRRKLVAIVAAAVLVVGGGVAAAVGVTQYNAETARLCEVALVSGAGARTAQEGSLAAAGAALEAVESVELPDGGTSTLYADLPAVEVATGTGTAPAVEARPSGAERIAAVTEAQAVLAEAEVVDECSDRDQATAITEVSDDAAVAVGDLDEAVAALSDDFAAFQVAEAARLAAEKKAAEEAAAEEAARIAAEQVAEGERQRQAEIDAWNRNNSGGGTNNNNNGGGTNNNGGQIIPPNGGGGCPPGTTFQGEGCS